MSGPKVTGCGLVREGHVKGVQVERRSDPNWRGLARLRPRVFIQTDFGEEAFLVNRANHVGDLIAELLPGHGA